jgi:hypothetical protein
LRAGLLAKSQLRSRNVIRSDVVCALGAGSLVCCGIMREQLGSLAVMVMIGEKDTVVGLAAARWLGSGLDS